EPNSVAQLHTIAKDVPAPPTRAGALTPVLEGMLDLDPARRWTAEHAASELRRIAGGGGPGTQGTSPGHRAAAAWAAGSVAGAGAAGAAAGAALGDGRADPPSTQAVPVVDPTRSIPHAAERPPEPWPGQNARSRPAGPEPHRDPADRRPAQPRQARG